MQDPDVFEPERFLPGTAAAAARPAHGWIPFGEGARACPGAKFGTEEAVLTLVRNAKRGMGSAAVANVHVNSVPASCGA